MPMGVRGTKSVLLCAAVVCFAADDNSMFREALAALERGDFAAVVQKLRPQGAAHPTDAPSLSLLAVALAGQTRPDLAALLLAHPPRDW